MKILVTCGGGLGNRLLGLASAMVLAERTGAALMVCWPLGNGTDRTGTPEGFACDLDRLYTPPCEVVTVQDRDRMLKSPHDHLNLKRQRQPLQPRHDLLYFYTHGRIRNVNATVAELRGQLQHLRPTVAVRDHHIEGRVLLGGPGPFWACLVRCHGHPRARQWGPERRFRQFFAERGGDAVYLACDDHDASQRLRRLYPELASLPRPWCRNGQQELEVVAAELQLMSEAEQFYGTPFCALSELAATMRPDGQYLMPPIVATVAT